MLIVKFLLYDECYFVYFENVIGLATNNQGRFYEF